MIRKLSFSKGAALLGGGGGNFLGGFHSAYYNTGRDNQVMGGVHSDGVGSILSYKGGRALRGTAQPITWVENQKKLGYTERALPHASPTMGNPDNNEKVGEVGVS